MQTFDIMSKQYIILVETDSMGLFCRTVLTIRSKMGMIQQNYNMTDRVNYGADAKRFTHRQCKKLT